MATGRRAFERKSRASLIAAILKRDPPLVSTAQTMAPPALDHAVRTCMAKDPDAHWQTAHDVLVELKWIVEAGSQAAITQPKAGRKYRREMVLSALLASVSIAFLVLAFLHVRQKAWKCSPSGFRFPCRTKWPWRLPDFPVVSPDGHRLVFAAANAERKRFLWMHAMDLLTLTPMAGAEDASAGQIWRSHRFRTGTGDGGAQLPLPYPAGGSTLVPSGIIPSF
jgi:hypothetical protein